jgi:hypothetical protein
MDKEPAKAVSIRATDAYIRALRDVADDRGVKVADLVRSVLDKELGSEMAPHLSFLAKRGKKNNQSAKKVIRTK